MTEAPGPPGSAPAAPADGPSGLVEGATPPAAAALPAGAPAALVDLAERIRGCTACPLALTRSHAVPGDGPVSARVMAVGEAPGETEDRTGRPFTGAAGRLLTRLLESIGLDRHDIYITNVLKCRPPQNRDPGPAEVAACSPFLDAQVELIRPDLILLLGRHALARLLPGRTSIGRLHGERLREGGRAYVPLYHPAAALYNGSMMETLLADMARVRGYLDEAAAERRDSAARAGAAATGSGAAAGGSADQLALLW